MKFLKKNDDTEKEALLPQINQKNYKNEYDTFIDMYAKGEKVIMITDKDNLKVYKSGVEKKVNFATATIFCFLCVQVLLHILLSYYNLKDCESKINDFNRSAKISDMNINTRGITYICASYVMHIFLMIGYFLIAFITTYKQSNILFQILEIYIIIMFISDLFFSFVNP